MGDNSHIEWTDATWNPATGCTRVSPGCDHCYIDRTPPFRMNGRSFDQPGVGGSTGVLLHPDRLDQPLRWTRGRRVFVNSLSDLFHDDIPDEYIAEVFAVMALAPQHTFQLLTKRHGRMRSLLTNPCVIDGPSGPLSFEAVVRNVAWNMRNRWLTEHPGKAARFPKGDDFSWPLPNLWLGVTVEDQKHADLRIPALLNTPAAVRFLSCEPLLGAIDLARVRPRTYGGSLFHDARWPVADRDTGAELLPALDWVIAGGESGPAARPMHPGWLRSLRDQCMDAAVAFHFKQWGEWIPVDDPEGSDVWVLPETGATQPWSLASRGADGGRWSPHPDSVMRRVGKKAAGRVLDGHTHDGYPAVVA
jgi:protein gp37